MCTDYCPFWPGEVFQPMQMQNAHSKQQTADIFLGCLIATCLYWHPGGGSLPLRILLISSVHSHNCFLVAVDDIHFTRQPIRPIYSTSMSLLNDQHLQTYEKVQNFTRTFQNKWQTQQFCRGLSVSILWGDAEAKTEKVSFLLEEPRQVLFDVDVLCWVSELASTHAIHYDQKKNACMWMTGDSGQTGEGGEVQGEMQGDQQMESVRDGELYI